MRVLVTGSTGFVGRVLCETLARAGHEVRAALRSHRDPPEHVTDAIVVGEIDAGTDWRDALSGVDAVVHAAARVHVLHESPDVVEPYIRTNTIGTQRLAEAAVEAGVRRFVYLSSVKVNGEETKTKGYSASDEPSPGDGYAISKWKAEVALREVSRSTGLEIAIIRPPLVYGPRVGANFLRLLRWVDKELPLPFGAVTNRRSLVSVWNLCDLISTAMTSSAAPGHTWMVSDGCDVSTPDLIRRIGAAMGRRVRLPAVPLGVLRTAAALINRAPEMNRLCGSLYLDIDATCRELDWSPPMTMDEGLRHTVEWYLRTKNSAG